MEEEEDLEETRPHFGSKDGVHHEVEGMDGITSAARADHVPADRKEAGGLARKKGHSGGNAALTTRGGWAVLEEEGAGRRNLRRSKRMR